MYHTIFFYVYLLNLYIPNKNKKYLSIFNSANYTLSHLIDINL